MELNELRHRSITVFMVVTSLSFWAFLHGLALMGMVDGE